MYCSLQKYDFYELWNNAIAQNEFLDEKIWSKNVTLHVTKKSYSELYWHLNDEEKRK